jgi:hypothetical protein
MTMLRILFCLTLDGETANLRQRPAARDLRRKTATVSMSKITN